MEDQEMPDEGAEPTEAEDLQMQVDELIAEVARLNDLLLEQQRNQK